MAVRVETGDPDLNLETFLPGFVLVHLDYPSRRESGRTVYRKSKPIPTVLWPFMQAREVGYDEIVTREEGKMVCTSDVNAGIARASVTTTYETTSEGGLRIVGHIKLSEIPIPLVRPLISRVIREEFLKLREQEMEAARQLLRRT